MSDLKKILHSSRRTTPSQESSPQPDAGWHVLQSTTDLTHWYVPWEICHQVLRTLTTAKAQRHSQFQWRRPAFWWPRWTVPALPGRPPPKPEPITWRRVWPPSTRAWAVAPLPTTWDSTPPPTAAVPIPKDRDVDVFLSRVGWFLRLDLPNSGADRTAPAWD